MPTTSEEGFANFQLSVWHDLYGPAGLPPEVTAKLAQALQTSLASPQPVERFNDLATAPASTEQATPAALGEKLNAELARWAPIIEKAGVFAD